MTNNKMPVVGKRYRNKFSYETYLLRCIEIDELARPEDFKLKAWFKGNAYGIYIQEFWNEYEELPDNLQQTNQPQVKENVLSDEVKKIIEDFKRFGEVERECLKPVASALGLISNKPAKQAIEAALELICLYGSKVTGLINALEAMEKSDIPEKEDCGIVENTKESGHLFGNKITLSDEDLKKLTVDYKSLRGELLYNGSYDSIPFPKSAIIGDYWRLRMDRYQTKEQLDILVCINNTENGGEKNFLYSQTNQCEKQPQSIWKDVSELSNDCAEKGKKQEEAEEEIKEGDLTNKGKIGQIRTAYTDNEYRYKINGEWLRREDFKVEKQPQSIWKDVSELPRGLDGVAVLYKNSLGEIRVGEVHSFWDPTIYPGPNCDYVGNEEIAKACLLSDFITQSESDHQLISELVKRVEKLEGK